MPTTSVAARKNRFDKDGPIDWKMVLPMLVIVAAGFWIYWPALDGAWLWDDQELIWDNPELRSVHGLWQIWFSAPTTDYWPLTWTLLWIEWHLWGNEPLGFHLCSLALHLSSAFLIWRLFSQLGLRHGWLGGLLFVIHPLAVESVAWVAEIKNTFSLPLFLLSCDAWLDAEEGKKTSYLRSVFYYLAAMLAKTSTVMLPVVLLLYCWWRRGRITAQEIRRMIPYGVIALGLGLVTVYFQSHKHENSPIVLGGLITRSIGAGTALFFYLGKFVLPVGLLPNYPVWRLEPPTLLQLLTLPALALLLFGLWNQRGGRGRHALFGFGFFLINVLPVLGFLKMQYMSISWVADHLVYLPMIGLIGLVVAGVGGLLERVSATAQLYGLMAIGIVMTLLAWESRSYASLFVDGETLWTYTLQHNPQAWAAHNNLGILLGKAGRTAEAAEQFREVLKLKPDYVEARNNLGIILMQFGQVSEAIDQFDLALKINPDHAGSHYNLGDAFMQSGRLPEAIEQFKRALQIDPDYTEAHNNLGIVLAQSGRAAEAIEQFEWVLKTKPDDADAHNNLGYLLMQAGHVAEATEQFKLALKFNPDFAEARSNLATAQALEKTGPTKN